MNTPAVAPTVTSPPGDRLDPYYVLAKKTGFVDYLLPGEPLRNDQTFAVSVELAKETSRPGRPGLSIRSAYDGSRFFTARATASAFEALSADPRVHRIQFAQPLAAPRAARPRSTLSPSPTLPDPSIRGSSRSPTLLGIVDNGCPFAHQALRKGTSTRVLSLWIQDSMSPRGPLGHVPTSFGYGLEFVRTELDHLISTAIDASGSVDEDLCYRLAGYDQVLHRRTHGAHSLGLLANPRRWLLQPGALASEIVSVPKPLESSSADIVFVQLPQTLMDCNSVAAVEHYAMDGFRHILDVAKARNYENVVISFGYESWVGAHDGTSWFESALNSLLIEARKRSRTEFFLAAGNSRIRHSHVEVTGDKPSATLQWHVPPGNEVPTFLEIWAPPSEDDLKIQLTPPGRRTLPELYWGSRPLLYPDARHPEVGIVMSGAAVLAKDDRVIVIRVSPTHSWQGRPTAPHGLWAVSIAGVKGSGIRAHLGRVEGDANSPRRTCQPKFVGRSTSEEESTDENRTLNGHACGDSSRVCGVFYSKKFPSPAVPIEGKTVRPARGQPANYSSAGPTGGRQQPDLSLPMEDGLYHEGALSIGTRSASVCRMKGTSTAAPAAACLFADGKFSFPTRSAGSRARAGPPLNTALGARLLDP